MTISATAIALLALVLGGGARLDEDAAWTALNEALQSHSFAANGRLQREPRPDYAKQLAKLEALMPRCVGTSAEPHAHFNRANTLYFLDRFDEALSGLEALKAKFPKHGLCTVNAFLPDQEGLSMVDAAIADCRAEIEIRKTYEVKELPAAVLDPKNSVIFHTRLGDFTMQFYPNVAPKTVANFLKLAREGFYNDTYFHSVRGLREVVGGCPNTKRSRGIDRNDDGEGSPGYFLDLEPSSALHAAGAVAMRAMTGTGKTSGSQFMICLTELPQYNNQQHVFGQITEGLDVVRLISQQVADDDGNPYDRVWITAVEVRQN
jgi:peptidyl-prolyl cis-trans isomerase B (cyclophilin B)